MIGVIHFSKLQGGDWWKKKGVSLILLPDPVVEDVDVKLLKKKSVELAIK
jgi:homoserine dehydrogenase